MSIAHPSIELRRVGILREGRWILRDIDWAVPPGTCCAILGPNGSGKSTLARVISCYLWPTAGEVAVLGARFGEVDLRDVRRDVRLVQPAGPYDIDATLTAREVVLTGFFSTLWLYDPVTPQMIDEADRLLEQVGLSQVADHAYATLSSGERVRSLIARALVLKPRLLLLDEPTAGLDLLAREQVLATVQAMFEGRAAVGGPRAARGAEAADVPDAARLAPHAASQQPHADVPPTVVFITHHVEELPPATERVLLLDEGRVAAAGKPEEVLRAEVLSRVYRCELEVSRRGGRYYVQVHPDVWRGLLERKP